MFDPSAQPWRPPLAAESQAFVPGVGVMPAVFASVPDPSVRVSEFTPSSAAFVPSIMQPVWETPVPVVREGAVEFVPESQASLLPSAT
jgi:hypothetical protein